MVYPQELVQKCIAKIIQHNSVVKNIFDEIDVQQGKVLLVGGAVRDCLLQQFGSDLDFEVYHIDFDKLQNILKKFGPVSFVGKSFGVLRLHGVDADWSIPRKDSSGRKPQVELDPNMSYEQAFKRRDLTVNAMGIDVKSLDLIDPYNGLQDLQNKVLRSPDVSFFVQDPLRLFRVMQFAARLQMQPNDELNKVCKTMDISNISSERIDDELRKLFLKSNQPSIGLGWLQTIGRWNDVFPDLSFDEKLLKSVDCLAKKELESSVKLYAMWGLLAANLKTVSFSHSSFSALSGNSGNTSKETLLLLKQFIKKYVHASEVIKIAAMISWYVHYIPLFATSKSNAEQYKWLAHWVGSTLNLEFLGTVGSCLFDQKIVNQFLTNAKQVGVLLKAEEPLVKGKDLLDVAQGKELGDLVKRAYELQINKNISDKQELLRKLN